jgi:hypothetical protein
VREGILSLRNHKALGDTWVSAELLKQLAPTVSPALASLFNHVRRQGAPATWNRITLISLFKKGDPALAANYRGIAIMGVLPKLYATIMTARLDAELEAGGHRAPT